MKVALQFAMPSELHALPGLKDRQPSAVISGIPIYELAPDLLAACGGVGKVNAAMCAQILCRHYRADLILNSGVAGCLTDLPIGALVLAEDFVQHDVDTTAVGDPIGLVSTVNTVTFPTWDPARCREILAELGHPAESGRVASGDWFAVKGDRAAWIRDTFHPVLTEMEGGAIAQAAALSGVPFGVIRVISDLADGTAPSSFDQFEQETADRSAATTGRTSS